MLEPSKHSNQEQRCCENSQGITIHSPLGSVTNGGAFASGHFKVTPHGQRRRWADMTPVEMWPATPSPGAGPETLHSFGVPAANATPTSPSTVPPQAFPAYTVPQSQPQQAPPSHMTVHPVPELRFRGRCCICSRDICDECLPCGVRH